MPGKGRPFPKGVSGNPGGRPKRDPEVRALCEKFTPDAIETLAEIMQDKDSQPSARVSAAMAILKKTLPDFASVEHTGDGPRPFAVIPEAMESAAEWEATLRALVGFPRPFYGVDDLLRGFRRNAAGAALLQKLGDHMAGFCLPTRSALAFCIAIMDF